MAAKEEVPTAETAVGAEAAVAGAEAVTEVIAASRGGSAGQLRLRKESYAPSRDGPLLQVSGILSSAARFDTDPDSSRVTASLRNMALKPVMTVRLIGAAAKLAHAVSIAARPVRSDHSGRHRPPHGSRPLRTRRLRSQHTHRQWVTSSIAETPTTSRESQSCR